MAATCVRPTIDLSSSTSGRSTGRCWALPSAALWRADIRRSSDHATRVSVVRASIWSQNGHGATRMLHHEPSRSVTGSTHGVGLTCGNRTGPQEPSPRRTAGPRFVIGRSRVRIPPRAPPLTCGDDGRWSVYSGSRGPRGHRMVTGRTSRWRRCTAQCSTEPRWSTSRTAGTDVSRTRCPRARRTRRHHRTPRRQHRRPRRLRTPRPAL